jgi:AhpD family alkylhydroperoxidase
MTTQDTYVGVIEDLKEPTRSLSEAIPDTWAGFARMHQSAVAGGALPAKTKELIALAIAVVKHCDGCIAYHAKAAARRGATPNEVAEALGVSLLMDGGTASVYAPRAWDAFREFAAAQAAAAAANMATGASMTEQAPNEWTHAPNQGDQRP